MGGLCLCILLALAAATGGVHQTFSIGQSRDLQLMYNGMYPYFNLRNSRDVIGSRIQGHFSSSERILAEPITTCMGYDPTDEAHVCLLWGDHNQTLLNVTQCSDKCYSIVVQNTGDSVDDDVTVTLEYLDYQWFGGPERFMQDWPLQHGVVESEAYITSSYQHSVAEPFWFNSRGGSIYVRKGVPLFVDSNHQSNGTLILKAAQTWPYTAQSLSALDVEICFHGNAKEALMSAKQRYWAKPSDLPDLRMVRHPVWSTWARYKTDIDQQTVLDFAAEIQHYGFPASQIEIDDKWETCYGAFEFDPARFPDPTGLVSQLHDQGHRVTLWVHPFVNTDCMPVYSKLLAAGMFVANDSGPVTTWWNGEASAIDFTEGFASEWWVERTRDLARRYGIDSFKFDAGETNYLPSLPHLAASPETTPNDYTAAYIGAVARPEVFGPLLEVRTADRTQHLAVFLRMLDKDSKWGLDNGLRSLVTTLLQLNMVGYGFVLPDMIGGNAYGADKATKELFIRWLQANALMPAMQYSIAPWDFDNETVSIARKFSDLREQLYPDIVEALVGAMSGTPVNPPIWWIDPEDEDALRCSDEFLVGTTLLVAPVLEEGARSRDIYLPLGLWQDLTRGDQGLNETLSGRQWLYNYTVGLDELPVFRATKFIL